MIVLRFEGLSKHSLHCHTMLGRGDFYDMKGQLEGILWNPITDLIVKPSRKTRIKVQFLQVEHYEKVWQVVLDFSNREKAREEREKLALIPLLYFSNSICLLEFFKNIV